MKIEETIIKLFVCAPQTSYPLNTFLEQVELDLLLD